jgi:hypothetical protein
MESNLLYCQETKSEVLNIMEQLNNDLNTYFECQIRISKFTSTFTLLFGISNAIYWQIRQVQYAEPKAFSGVYAASKNPGFSGSDSDHKAICRKNMGLVGSKGKRSTSKSLTHSSSPQIDYSVYQWRLPYQENRRDGWRGHQFDPCCCSAFIVSLCVLKTFTTSN